MKKRIFSLALVLCFILTFSVGAWAATYSGASTINYLDSDGNGHEVNGYDYNDNENPEYIYVGDEDNLPDDLKIVYVGSSGSLGSSAYVFLCAGDGTLSASNATKSLSLGNGLTATVTHDSDGNSSTLSITGTPTKAGTVSFKAGRFSNSTPSGSVKGESTLKLTVTKKSTPTPGPTPGPVDPTASTKAPSFTTRAATLTGEHGKPFKFTIKAKDNVDPSEDGNGYSMITISDDMKEGDGALSAAELEALYGITVSNTGSGDLILSSTALQAPTSADLTITFVAQVSNDFTWYETYENSAGAEYAEDNGYTGDYTIKSSPFTLKINPIKPEITHISRDQTLLRNNNKDLGTYPVSEDKVIIWVGTNYTTARSGDILTAKDLPAGLTFEISQDEDGNDYEEVSTDCGEFTVPVKRYVYKLYGTPDKAETKTITITPENTAYNSKGTAVSGLKMTILDRPSISNPAANKELTGLTYGKTYSQPLTLKGGDNSHKARVLSADYLPRFLTVSSKDNKITGEFSKLAHVNQLVTVIEKLKSDGVDGYADLTEVPVDGFGDNASISFDVVLYLSCDVFTDLVSESRKIVISTVKPEFAKNLDKTINAAIKALNLKAEETGIDEPISITATAPGIIEWSYDKLPEGIYLNGDETGEVLSPDKTGLNSVVTLSGTPKKPAKGFKSKITAKNGAGSVSMTLTFDISAPTPKIKYQTWDEDAEEYTDVTENPFSGDFKVGDTFNVRVYNDADGAGKTKFTASKLPGGLTPKQSGDKAALIIGTVKTATKAKTEGTITAQDEESAAKPSASDKFEYNVYALPKITTSKLDDLTVGKYSTSTIAADSVSKWYISHTSVNAVDDATEIDGETDPEIYELISADTSTNSKGAIELKVLRFVNVIPSSTDRTIRVWAQNLAGEVSKDLKYKVKGEKVKITTSKLPDFYPTAAGSETIKFTGSETISSIAYISANDAKSAGLNDGEMIMLNGTTAQTDYNLTYSNGTIAKGAGTPLHKGIKITVSADNGLGAAKKTYTLAVKGMDPKWLSSDIDVTNKTMGTGKGTQDYEKNLLTYNVDLDKDNIVTLTVSGDKPFEISYGTLPEGISIDITSNDGSLPKVKILYEQNDNAKPGSKKVAFTAKNPSTGKSAKVNVQLTALQKPNIDNKETLTNGKEVESGKKLTLKAVLKPADKNATWAIVSADVPFDHSTITSAADIAKKFGITIDSKGTIGGTTKSVTSADGGGADFMKLRIWVSNDAGEDFADAYVKIKGSKPKIGTKEIKLDRGVVLDDDHVSEDKRLVKAQGIESSDIKMTLDTDNAAILTGLGLGLNPTGLLTGTPTKGTKGTNVTISADHFGAKANIRVKIIVVDPESTATPYDGDTAMASSDVIEMAGTVNAKGKVTDAVTKQITVRLDPAPTNVPTWKVATKPNYNGLTAKVETEGKTNSQATITLTLKKGAAAGTKSGDTYPDKETSFVISAQNKDTKDTYKTDPILVKVSFTAEPESTKQEEEVTDENTDSKATDKKLDEKVEEELTKELGEGDLSIGAERTDSALTDEQKAAIKAEGYMIAAILPEISATVDGQYGLEVDLLADVPAGSELKWLAYPQSPAEPSTDDEIADFFDIDGADTTTVPSDHIVLVYPWLREGVKYAPVIVAKVSEAAPGDVVSEEGIDEAVENAKEGAESTEEIVLDEEGKTTEAPAENANTETPAEEAANDESKPEETSTEAQSE